MFEDHATCDFILTYQLPNPNGPNSDRNVPTDLLHTAIMTNEIVMELGIPGRIPPGEGYRHYSGHNVQERPGQPLQLGRIGHPFEVSPRDLLGYFIVSTR
jgi:hypothetical protein